MRRKPALAQRGGLMPNPSHSEETFVPTYIKWEWDIKMETVGLKNGDSET